MSDDECGVYALGFCPDAAAPSCNEREVGHPCAHVRRHPLYLLNPHFTSTLSCTTPETEPTSFESSATWCSGSEAPSTETSSIQRCGCPSCQRCLPSCFDDPSECPYNKDAESQRGVCCLLHEIKPDKAIWQLALQRCCCYNSDTHGAGRSSSAPWEPPARYGHTAVIDRERRTMVVFGGRGPESFLSDVCRFDIRSSLWTSRECNEDNEGRPWPEQRCGHTASVYRRFMYVLSGGLDSSTNFADDLWRYNLDTGEWTKECYRLPFSPRKGHTMHTLLAACSVGRTTLDMLVVYGGLVRFSRQRPRPGDPDNLSGVLHSADSVDLPTSDVWLYQLSTGRWALLKVTGDVPAPRSYHVSQLIESTTMMIVFGGRTCSPATVTAGATPPTQAATTLGTCLNDLHILDISTGVWRAVRDATGAIPPPLTCCASVWGNGVFALFAGGDNEMNENCYEFRVDVRRWRRVTLRNQLPCSRPTVVYAGDRLIQFGGCSRTCKIYGSGRNGVAHLPLPPLSLRNHCNAWVRRTAFKACIRADTRRCSRSASPDTSTCSIGSGGNGERIPVHNFSTCWACSPSGSLSPQQQYQRSPVFLLNAASSPVTSSPGARVLAVPAAGAAALAGRPASPRAVTAAIAAGRAPLTVTPTAMSPTEPLPVAALPWRESPSSGRASPAVARGVPSPSADDRLLGCPPAGQCRYLSTGAQGVCGFACPGQQPPRPPAGVGAYPCAGSGPCVRQWVPPRCSPRLGGGPCAAGSCSPPGGAGSRMQAVAAAFPSNPPQWHGAPAAESPQHRSPAASQALCAVLPGRRVVPAVACTNNGSAASSRADSGRASPFSRETSTVLLGGADPSPSQQALAARGAGPCSTLSSADGMACPLAESRPESPIMENEIGALLERLYDSNGPYLIRVVRINLQRDGFLRGCK